MNLVGELPIWVGAFGSIIGLWLMIGAFQKAPDGNPTFFNYLRPKRFFAGIPVLAVSVDIIFF